MRTSHKLDTNRHPGRPDEPGNAERREAEKGPQTTAAWVARGSQSFRGFAKDGGSEDNTGVTEQSIDDVRAPTASGAAQDVVVRVWANLVAPIEDSAQPMRQQLRPGLSFPGQRPRPFVGLHDRLLVGEVYQLVGQLASRRMHPSGGLLDRGPAVIGEMGPLVGADKGEADELTTGDSLATGEGAASRVQDVEVPSEQSDRVQ